MDNYSRYIHSWKIETAVSAKTRLATIQDALQTTFKGVEFKNLQLITDGGPENENLTMREFMQQLSIQHSIALRDIVQSNSMMEAFYRTTKYRRLYLKKIENGKQLHKEFEHWIDEYNHHKPHHALGIYTPFEVLNGKQKKESFKERMIAAARERRLVNKNASCNVKCCD